MKNWTRADEIALINEKQAYYVDRLIELLESEQSKVVKTINFTSSTGTGKTNMMANLINKMPYKYFVVTTLSRGQLHRQVSKAIGEIAVHGNFVVYGLHDYTSNTKRTADDIISGLPHDCDIIWIRDEGHINTNKWQEILSKRVVNVVNVSATNRDKQGVVCNFTETMMLRTVKQHTGSAEDAIQRLIDVKREHAMVENYNPCALFRVLDDKTTEDVIALCTKYGLRYINITTQDYDMADICRDDNEYDIIINKFKITEGTNLKRAHVLYMDNKPGNLATVIQVIGRCRRNALLWRKDIDIFAAENAKLLEDTRKCYVFYNVEDMSVTEKDGELLYELCDKISVEELSSGARVYVKNGIMPNGLEILELSGMTGGFNITTDEQTGFNVVDNPEFYEEEIEVVNHDMVVIPEKGNLPERTVAKLFIRDNWKLHDTSSRYDYRKNQWVTEPLESPYYEEDYIIKTEKKVAYNAIATKVAKYEWVPSGAMCGIRHEKNGQIWIEWKTPAPMYDGISVVNWKKILDAKKDGETHYTYMKETPWKTGCRIAKDEVHDKGIFAPYKKTTNDRQMAIVGPDKFYFTDKKWVPNRAVGAKVSMHCKFNSFISSQYNKEIKQASKQLFTGKNPYNFDKRTNAVLGFSVEYFTKYLVYGERFFGRNIERVIKENKAYSSYDTDGEGNKKLRDGVIIRAAMLCYRETMVNAFGSGAARLVRTISIDKLLDGSNDEFVKVVAELSHRSAEFIRGEFGIENGLQSMEQLKSPNLSVRHVTGLCDFINKDTIIDLKVTNHIDAKMMRQMFGYHYLSTRREDLEIKQVIVFDAISGKHTRMMV